ncbi:hypothetical protein PTKIN_Ptkin14bG0029700 [Pterospermum kingtungense]
MTLYKELASYGCCCICSQLLKTSLSEVTFFWVLKNMKQKIIIKVSMNCSKCRRKALKIAAVADGVISVALHGPEKDKLLIIGEGVDAVCLTACLRKKLCYACLETIEEVKEEKKGEEKEKEKEKDPII